VIFKTHRRRTLVQSVPDAALQDWIAWRQFSPSHTSRRIAYSVEQVVAARVSAGPLGRLCIDPVLATCHGNCDERDRRASRSKGGLRRRPRLFRSPRSPAPRIRRIRQGEGGQRLRLKFLNRVAEAWPSPFVHKRNGNLNSQASIACSKHQQGPISQGRPVGSSNC
jgi:hypothetical protein